MISGKIFGLMIGMAVLGSIGFTEVYAQTPDVWIENVKRVASDGNGTAFFGEAVAIDGDFMVVGARLHNSSSGSAYIFERNQGGVDNWGEVKTITASDGAAGDEFGAAVGISGDTIIVGSTRDNSSTGAVYIFERNQGGSNNWGESQKITALDSSANDFFGQSIGIDGSLLVVGTSIKSAYVFENPGSTWGQIKKISGGTGNGVFGSPVSISGNMIIIGDYESNTLPSVDQGAVFIYERDQGGVNNWGQVKKLTASDGMSDDDFGVSVDIFGDLILVGDDGKAPLNLNGTAYIFERNHGGINNWGEVKKLTASDQSTFFGQRFGTSVALNNNTAIVGAPFDDEVSSNSGAVFIFKQNQGGANNWGEIQKVTVTDGGEFGIGVDIFDKNFVSGARRDGDNGSNSGASYVFNEQCQVPVAGDFIITSDCQMIQSTVVPANIIVQNNSVLTIPNGVTLTIATGNNITIELGSGVLIQSGTLQINS